jgi:Zn-dependent protease with chaperone function
MVIGCVLAAMVAAGEVNLTVAIALTVVINLLIWLVSPWLSDLTLRWFNSLEFLDDAAVRRLSRHSPARPSGGRRLSLQAPRIGFIPDRNPTAFTYGLLRGNAASWSPGHLRVLERGGAARVVAHELGHIVNRDFILMTMAGMLVRGVGAE